MSVAVLTNIPSPYQVELFDAVAARGEFSLRAAYLAASADGRRWERPAFRHEHAVGEPARTREWVLGADLAVFSNYRHPFAAALLRERAATGRPWCFWGERPGFSRAGVLGRLFRRWKLAPLRRSRAPIWGIGSWAVAAYRREFGDTRTYFDVPYFSDLARFAAPKSRPAGRRRFLFSGSLLPRKGADLLATAFARLAAEHPDVELDVLGDGRLRRTMELALTGCRDRVRFLGFRQWPELPAAYRDADILVVPSRYDGWGLVVPEGLAAGMPVIGTDRTGAALDLIAPGANGWRVRAGSEEALHQAMREAAALTDVELAAMSGRAAASVVCHSLAAGAARWAGAARRTLEAWQ